MAENLASEARQAVRAHLAGEPMPAQPDAPRSGVFVTIRDRAGLRGCIGYTEAVMPLYGALQQAAVAAATQDPRFEPLRMEELDGVSFEVTVLDEPVPITSSPLRRIDVVRPGRDGLIVRRGKASGLLLPQVAAEYGWSALQLLQNTCIKAGLPPDSWQEQETRVYTFSGRTYGESSVPSSVSTKT